MEGHPRIKNFLCRFAWGILPMNLRLKGKGIQADEACEWCKKSCESYGHLFFGCKKVKDFWCHLGIEVGDWEDVVSPRQWYRISLRLKCVPQSSYLSLRMV